MNKLLKILIVDDHEVVRRGLKQILSEAFHDALFGEAQNGAELLRYIRNQTWDVVILDINMPGRSGLELLKDLKQEHPRLPVLVLSVHSEDQYAIRVLRAGGAGYLAKATAPEELVVAVKKVLAGGKYVSAAAADKLLSQLEANRDTNPHETLSDREFQVLRLMASGKTPTEIADDLGLNVKTISTFRTRLLTKMDMRNNAELTRYAIENHLLD